MRLLQEFGVCDSHSHVYGPFDRFPLADARTFTPPESPISELEAVWSELGIDRAVLVQGSAHGEDHRALVDALSRAPERRRGIALISDSVSSAKLSELHGAGVRGVRFNWVRHLLDKDPLSQSSRLSNAAGLLERISSLDWHAEIHIEVDDLEWVRRLEVPHGMVIVIDHMARPDVTSNQYQSQLHSLLELLKHEFVWLKLSGADRASSRSGELQDALPWMRSLAREAADRCIWGLDWPHVNLAKRSDDGKLAGLLLRLTDDESTLQKILIRNPEKLYGFSSQPMTSTHESH
jgi:2-pyrone-4,6-dicarboxylate lactonase